MRKNIVIFAVVAIAAYLVGRQSAAVHGRDYEDLRHQLERMWNDPRARKSRKEAVRKVEKAARRATGRRRG